MWCTASYHRKQSQHVCGGQPNTWEAGADVICHQGQQLHAHKHTFGYVLEVATVNNSMQCYSAATAAKPHMGRAEDT